MGKSWKVLFRETVEENLQKSKVPGYGSVILSWVIGIPRVLEGTVMQDDHTHEFAGF